MGAFGTILQIGLGLASMSQAQQAAKKRSQASAVERISSVRAARREAQIKQASMRAFAQTAGVGAGTYNESPLSATMDQRIGNTGQQTLLGMQAAKADANANVYSGLGDAVGLIDFDKLMSA